MLPSLTRLCVLMNILHVLKSQRTARPFDEVEASRRSRKRAWENLAEIRFVLKDTAGVDLPPPREEDH